MARLPQLIEIAKTHDLKIISIDDLVAYRMRRASGTQGNGNSDADHSR